MTRHTPRFQRPASAAVVLLLMSCGGGNPTQPPTATAPPAAATTTPAPTASPTPQNGVRGCNLPPLAQPGGACTMDGPIFLSQVDAAVNLLKTQRPDLFNGNSINSPGQFYLGVIANLEAKGLCAAFDGEEIQVKNTQDYSEQYHLMTSGRILRWGDVTYRATCRPAAFPTVEPPLGQRGDCSLPSSRSITCNDETPRYLGQVQSAIDQLRREQPGLFKGDYVLNSDQYYAGVVRILKTKLTCAIFDGEEVAVKNDNFESEQYHIQYSWGQIRNDNSAYRASCYPATF
jgi:hypothetical protein